MPPFFVRKTPAATALSVWLPDFRFEFPVESPLATAFAANDADVQPVLTDLSPSMCRSLSVSCLSIVLLFVSFGCSAEARKEKLLDRASAFMRAGEYDKAEIECLNVLKIDRENVRALEHLGVIWHDRGAPLRALPFLAAVRTKSPGNRDVQRRVMQITLQLGKLAEARRDALALLQRAPDDKEALLVLSRAARAKADLEQVDRALARADRGSAQYHLASANLLLRRGDAGAAAAALQRAQALEPKSAQVRMARAAYHLWLNQRDQAGAEFKAAAELAPTRSNEKIRYAEFLAESGKVAEARTLLEEITQKAPDYLPAWRGLAYLALAEKKTDAAKTALEKIFSRDPGNYEGRLTQAQLLLAQNDGAKAVEELVALEKQYPAMADDKLLLGQAYLQLGDPVKARSALRSAVTQNPDHQEAVMLLARLNLAAGEPNATAQAMGEWLTHHPTSVPAQMLFLDAMRAMGRLEEAVESIRKQVAAAPERVELHRLLGLVLLQAQKPDEARKSLERSLELTPGFLPIVAELVALELREKNFAGAMRRVQAELARSPEPAVRFLEARVLSAEGRWDQAETVLLKVLEEEPQMIAAYDLLADGYVARASSSAVLARMDEYLARRPGELQVVLMAGRVYTRLQQYAKARASYEAHLTVRPDSPLVLNNLAYLCAEHLDDPARALELARKARQLDAASPEIADTLGLVLYRRQEYAAALELFKEASGKAPRNPEILYHVGLASQQLGQHDVARAAFERAQKAGGDFPGKADIARRLAELPGAAAPR